MRGFFLGTIYGHMRNILKYVTDIIAVVFAVLFHAPSKRFDEIVGSEQEKYTGLTGSTAVVTEVVTKDSGMVRYSGSNWRARLSEKSNSTSIDVGEKVTIDLSEGNILYVTWCMNAS